MGPLLRGRAWRQRTVIAARCPIDLHLLEPTARLQMAEDFAVDSGPVLDGAAEHATDNEAVAVSDSSPFRFNIHDHVLLVRKDPSLSVSHICS